MNKIVIKLTGHLFKCSSIDPSLYELINFIKNDFQNNNRIYYVVVGGGEYSRLLIENLRKQGVNEYLLDQLGIMVTRVHAHFILNLLRPHVHEKVPHTIEEAVKLDRNKQLNLVMGGVRPGFSTNAVSVMLAKAVGAKLLITMSRSGGLYTDDPQVNPNAILIKSIHIDEIENYLGFKKEKAGFYPLLDKVSINLLKKYRINTYITSPSVNNIRQILEGGNPGTHIIF